jgi:hypothetical protein
MSGDLLNKRPFNFRQLNSRSSHETIPQPKKVNATRENGERKGNH